MEGVPMVRDVAKTLCALTAAGACLWFLGCAGGSPAARSVQGWDPQPQFPAGEGGRQPGTSVPGDVPDLTAPGAVAWGTTPAEVLDTRTMPPFQDDDPTAAWRPSTTYKLIRDHIPPHEKAKKAIGAIPPQGEENALAAGATLEEPRTVPGVQFPTIGATGWNPPDPTLAVGPNHVLVTVNMTVAWYTKTGTPQFSAILGSQGNPGFFEAQGAGTFTFDPKCVYDHIAQRFVIMVLEVYTGTGEAYIDVAVSDDSDPNGIWYKYRTPCVLNISGINYWWDYPGLGYDGQAYYVTSNLFAFGDGPYGGNGFRIFNKSPLLTGAPATYATLREPNAYILQPARHFGSNSVPYFTYIPNSTTVRIYAITNPLTSPAVVSTNVTVPSYTGPVGAPTLGGGTMTVGNSTDPTWRNGQLYWCHNASVNGRNIVRWHQFATNNWPTSGGVTRVQSGDVDAGPGLFTIFPAMAANSAGDIALVTGVTGPDHRVSVRVAGRRSTDPAGRMGEPTVMYTSDGNVNGRWGDYYHIAVDPVDDLLFWGVGEYGTATGAWQNWVGSFRVSDQSVCHPVSDDAGVFQTSVAAPATIDVLANDWHSSNLPMTIASFSPTSSRGGTITRSVGTGPGGRDRLTYTPPLNSAGLDSFTYTVNDAGGNPASAAVVAQLYNPATYRNPENPAQVRPQLEAAYYDLVAPGSLPNFSTLTPYLRALRPSINFPSTSGQVALSGRNDNVGIVFAGYINIPATDLYRFHIASDDGSRVYLGETLIIDHDGLHGMTERSSALIGLKPGRHALRVEYFEAGVDAGVILSLSSGTISKAAVPASMLFSTLPTCTADFDGDGDTGTDADIQAFFACLAGNCCPLCGSADFNNDGDTGTDADIESFFRVLAGGPC
jgi:hypothetical protein